MSLMWSKQYLIGFGIIALLVIGCAFMLYKNVQEEGYNEHPFNFSKNKQAIIDTDTKSVSPTISVPMGQTYIEWLCDYDIQTSGNESFYDYTITKLDEKECGEVKIDMVFNATKRNNKANEFLAYWAERDPNNISVVAIATSILSYEPTNDIRFEKEGIESRILKEVEGNTSKYSFIADPTTDYSFKIGESSATITQKSAIHGVDYARNVTIEPNNVSHLNITSEYPFKHLVVYFPFDGDVRNVTAYDWTNNNIDGTYSNVLLNNSCLYDACGSFSGNDDIVGGTTNSFINFGDQAKLSFTNNLTFAVWINTRGNSTSTQQSIFTKDEQGTRWMEYNFALTKPKKVIFQINSGNTNDIRTLESAGILENGQWYHVVATYDGANQRIYINGVQNSSRAETISLWDSDSRFYIGANGLSAPEHRWSFNGSIEEAMILNKSLNASEVLDLYNNASERFSPFGWQSNNATLNISEDNNRVNVSIDGVKLNMSTNFSVAVGYINDTGWQLTPYQNITEWNTNYIFELFGSTRNITLNRTLISTYQTNVTQTNETDNLILTVANSSGQVLSSGTMTENTFGSITTTVRSQSCSSNASATGDQRWCPEIGGSSTLDAMFWWNLSLPSDYQTLYSVNITSIAAKAQAVTESLNLTLYNYTGAVWQSVNSSANPTVGINTTFTYALRADDHDDFISGGIIRVMSHTQGGSNADINQEYLSANVSYRTKQINTTTLVQKPFYSPVPNGTLTLTFYNVTEGGGDVDSDYPNFYNFTDNNASQIGTGQFNGSVNINKTNGTIGIEFNAVNYTPFNSTGAVNYWNISINSISSGTYPYYWWAKGNGSSGNHNSSAIRYYTINASANSCSNTCTTGNVIFNCWDNCSLTSNLICGNKGNNVTFNGTGTFTLLGGNISNFTRRDNYNQCHIISKSGGGFK